MAQSAALAEARDRGARLAVVDPRRSSSAARAEHWLRVRPGTDAALALGLAGLVITGGGLDERFVRAWTNGPLLVRADTGRFALAEELDPELAGHLVWDETAGRAEPYDTALAARRPERFALRGLRRLPTRTGPVEVVPAFEHYASACEAWTPGRTASATGVPSARLRAFAEDLGTATSVAYHSWTGVGQHHNATQTERAIATLYALTGSFDAPGGNVILPRHPVNPVTAPEQLAPAQRAKALGAADFPLGPPAQGWVSARSLCQAILAGQPYRVRALLSFGGNLLLSQPDPRRTRAALRELEFGVHLDLFENPSSRYADIVLPVNSPWEREAVKVGFEISAAAQQRVQLRPRMVAPVGASLSDTEVVFALACRLGMAAEFFEGDVVAGWDHQLAPIGLSVRRLREHPGGVDLGLRTHYRKYAERDGTGRVRGFNTPTRRVELYSQRLAEHGYSPVPEHRERAAPEGYPLLLTCAKNGYFCHSQHRGIASLRKRSAEPTVELNDATAAARGIADGQWVVIGTPRATARMRARLDPSLHPEVVLAEYGWWQDNPELVLPGSDPLADGGGNYNLLVEDAVHDPISGSVPMRGIPCEVSGAPDSGWRGRREFVVTAREAPTESVRLLRLRPADGGALPGFRPGQHVTVAEAPDGAVARGYSLTGGARDEYEIAVRRVPGGLFSTLVHQRVWAGTRLWLTEPAGLFAIPTELAQPVVLLAAGIGITPFLGYLRALAAGGGTVPEVVLHHGSRDAGSHLFGAELGELASAIPELRVVNHYSAGEPPPGVRRGRVRAEHVAGELIGRRARFYLCGPEAMLTELTAGLVERGVPRFDIFTEKFRAAPRTVAVAPDASATVRFARSGRVARWRSADGTLLQLAERHGVALPSGCRLGQCESCAVPVLDGEVTHLVATADDLPDNHCLTCQSVPLSDLTLDA